MCSCHFYNFADLIFYFDIEYTTEEDRNSVLNNLFIDDSCLHLIQSHVHYIDKSMIKGIYQSYEYSCGDDYYGSKNLEYYRNKLL